MRKIIVTEFVSLDGVMESPMWTFPYWNDEIASFKAEETTANDVLLIGRVTLKLTETRSFSSGVVGLIYQPAE
jgi:hypothetical protein